MSVTSVCNVNEYQVSVTSVCNVVEAVPEHLGNTTVYCLPDPRTVSYFAYEQLLRQSN